MKHLLLAFLFALSLASAAQTVHPHYRATQHQATAAQPMAIPKVYVCGGDSVYALP
jgi:hypothetical protein